MTITCGQCPGNAVDLGPEYVLCPISPGKMVRASMCAYSIENLRGIRSMAMRRIGVIDEVLEAMLTPITAMHKDAGKDCSDCKHFYALTADPDDVGPDCQRDEGGCRTTMMERWEAR